MNKLIYDNVIISVREFMVLSALCGITRVELPMKKKQDLPDQKEVNLLLFQLYQKQILKKEEQAAYSLEPGIKNIFMNIKSADNEIQVYYPAEKSLLLLFPGKDIVTMELSDNDIEAVKLHCISREKFIEELCKKNILPKKESGKSRNDLRTENPALYREIKEKCRHFMKTGKVEYDRYHKYSGSGSVRISFLIKERETDIEKKQILLFDCGLWDCMAAADLETDHMEAGYYTKKWLRNLLLM